MELKKEDIQILRTKSKASSQVTFDVDYNVPDVKPDIGRMIQNKGEMTVEEVRLNEGHAFLKGKLQSFCKSSNGRDTESGWNSQRG